MRWRDIHFEGLAFVAPDDKVVHSACGDGRLGSQAGGVRSKGQPLRDAEVERIACVGLTSFDVDTEVLKDGDIVEVDANRGMIRIL